MYYVLEPRFSNFLAGGALLLDQIQPWCHFVNTTRNMKKKFTLALIDNQFI